MRIAAAVVLAGLVFIPSAGVAQETVPSTVEAPQSAPIDQAEPGVCAQPVDKRVCVAAISGAAVGGVIAANAVTGGALTPVLLAGNGGLSVVVVGLLVAHLGIDVVLITSGSAAAVVTGVADPVVAAAGDVYATAKSYAVSAADSVSTAASDGTTAIRNWLNGR